MIESRDFNALKNEKLEQLKCVRRRVASGLERYNSVSRCDDNAMRHCNGDRVFALRTTVAVIAELVPCAIATSQAGNVLYTERLSLRPDTGHPLVKLCQL